MALDVGLSRLIGFCVDIALSMVYTALFIGAMRSIKKRWHTTDISLVIPSILIVMFMLNVTQLCLQGVDIYNAFFLLRDRPGEPAAYFDDFSSQILPARDAIFWTLSVLSDTLVIWRLYVIWLQNIWVIILPCMILISSIGSGVTMYVNTIRRMRQDSAALSPSIDRWWMITMGLAIALNVIAPGLIIGRLWYIARHVGVLGSRSSKPYRRIGLALMESGALYTIAVAGWLIIFASNSLPALWMSACILPTIVAIVPTLIIIRINHVSKTLKPVRTEGTVASIEWNSYPQASLADSERGATVPSKPSELELRDRRLSMESQSRPSDR